ncbi:hypothetical protein HMPREF3197_05376 [Klebsiella pneumoniae]|nr:hypothetical protein HMPREF3197_05376 [Klebsiella pneumoniae]
MLLAVRDWLLPLSRLVSEETDMPPLAWALLPLSWLAALLRESCQEAAWAPERVNALTASAAITLFLNDFIDGLISVTE